MKIEGGTTTLSHPVNLPAQLPPGLVRNNSLICVFLGLKPPRLLGKINNSWQTGKQYQFYIVLSPKDSSIKCFLVAFKLPSLFFLVRWSPWGSLTPLASAPLNEHRCHGRWLWNCYKRCFASNFDQALWASIRPSVLPGWVSHSHADSHVPCCQHFQVIHLTHIYMYIYVYI